MLGVGIVGCGNFGAAHARAIRQCPDAEIVAFCDLVIDRALSYRNMYGTSHDMVTTDYMDLVYCSDVDAVIIVTHHDSHVAIGVEAARAGKHVLTEKPVALSFNECLRLYSESRQAGIICHVGFKFRHSSVLDTIRDEIGCPAIIDGAAIDSRWSDEYWAQDPILGGGNVFSQGPHLLDSCIYLSNSRPIVVEALARTVTHDTGTDQAVVLLAFENNCIASLAIGDSGLCGGGSSKWRVSVHGGKNTAHISNHFRSAELLRKEGVKSIEHGPDNLVLLQDTDFVNCILSGGAIGRNDIASGVVVGFIMDAAINSSINSIPIKIEWDGNVPISGG